MGNTALNRLLVSIMTNKSGGAVVQGDVVIIDSANAAAFTTTTTSAYSNGTVGVVLEPNGIADNASGMIAFAGYVPKISLSGAASLGDLFKTHSVVKQAVRHAAPLVAGDFGQVLGTGTTPAALLWGAPKPSAGSGTFVGPGSAVAGNMVTFGDTSGQLGADGGTPGMIKLSETLLAAPAANIDITGISGSYRHLRLIFQGRSSSANVKTVNLKFNNDGGANYNKENLNVGVTTVAGAESLAQTSMVIGVIPASNSTAGLAGAFELTIPNYAGTTFVKNFISYQMDLRETATDNLHLQISSCWWNSTAAINRITLTPSADNFAIGTILSIYGLS